MISINQPYFFPNIGYFSLLCSSSTHFFLDEVNMRKKSWITRNVFQLENGIVSIPVQKLSQNRSINQHFLKDKVEAKKVFLEKFSNFNFNQPFLHEAMDLAASSFETKEELLNISELNQNGIIGMSERLGLNINFKLQSDYTDIIGKKEDLLINICKCLGYTNYINLEGGSTLYNKEYFAEKGIFLYFMTNKELKKALGKEFNISILSLYAKYGSNKLADILLKNSEYD